MLGMLAYVVDHGVRIAVAAFEHAPIGKKTLEIQFTDKSEDDYGIKAWKWDFGDGKTSKKQHPTHTYKPSADNIHGTGASSCHVYDVTLIVTDTGDQETKLKKTIKIKPVDYAPVAGFDAHQSKNTLTVAFTDLSHDNEAKDKFQTNAGIESWMWVFDDGATSTDQNPTHEYTKHGEYAVSLTVTDKDGQDTTVCKSILVQQVDLDPDAAFSYYQPENTLVLEFTNLSTDDHGIASLKWDFGDGSKSTDENPNHTWKKPGTYTVALTAVDSAGNANTVTRTVTIKSINFAPVVGFDPYIAKNEYNVEFNNTTKDDGGIENVTFQWDFGDGEASTDFEPTHVYSGYGKKTVTLVATDAGGLSTTVIKTIDVPEKDFAPVAGFKYEQDFLQGEPGLVAADELEVMFVNESTDDHDGLDNGMEFVWHFGDDESSSVTHPVHVYRKPGRYEVTLIAKDRSEQTAQLTKQIEVHTNDYAPVAGFDVKIDLETKTATFENLSQDDCGIPKDGYLWDFGDGKTSKEEHPTHEYKKSGTYSVTLAVKDTAGQKTTLTKNVVILDPNEPPKASFRYLISAGPSGARSNVDAHFSNTSTDDSGFKNLTSVWDFGDGTPAVTDNSVNPTHLYKKAGVYDVTLTVTDNAGASDKVTKSFCKVGAGNQGKGGMVLDDGVESSMWKKKLYDMFTQADQGADAGLTKEEFAKNIDLKELGNILMELKGGLHLKKIVDGGLADVENESLDHDMLFWLLNRDGNETISIREFLTLIEKHERTYAQMAESHHAMKKLHQLFTHSGGEIELTDLELDIEFEIPSLKGTFSGLGFFEIHAGKHFHTTRRIACATVFDHMDLDEYHKGTISARDFIELVDRDSQPNTASTT